MRYCISCVLPDTRPNLEINLETGLCDGCSRTDSKERDVNWDERELAFKSLVNNTKKRSNNGYDCLIPVSGGKDSTWQVITCLKYGLKPLCVTWKTPSRTNIGQKNLDNLIALGVDHIDYQINPKVEKKLLYRALVDYGAIGIPMHFGIYPMQLKLALNFNIPLIVWGENSGMEYGGGSDETNGFKLTSKWLEKFGVTHGTNTEDWVSNEVSEQDLIAYSCPSDEEIEAQGINAVFLGYYFKWDPEMTYRIAKDAGFLPRKNGPKLGLYDFTDIDCNFISLHHYPKWLKFGFTRLWDNVSLEIRNGRMTRNEAIEIIKDKGDQTPHKDIDKFCKFVDIRVSHFHEICEKYRNLDIWYHHDGVWKIQNFLIKDWDWDYENR